MWVHDAFTDGMLSSRQTGNRSSYLTTKNRTVPWDKQNRTSVGLFSQFEPKKKAKLQLPFAVLVRIDSLCRLSTSERDTGRLLPFTIQHLPMWPMVQWHNMHVDYFCLSFALSGKSFFEGCECLRHFSLSRYMQMQWSLVCMRARATSPF